MNMIVSQAAARRNGKLSANPSTNDSEARPYIGMCICVYDIHIYIYIHMLYLSQPLDERAGGAPAPKREHT